MSQSSLLADLSEALDSNNFGAARRHISQLEKIFVEQQQGETKLDSRLSALYSSSSDLSAAESATVFNTVQKASSRRFSRVVLIVSVNSLLANLDQLSDQEVESAVEDIQPIVSEMQVSEAEFNTAVEESEPIVRETAVPPQVAFSSFTLGRRVLDHGEDTTLTVGVENVGEKTAERITVLLSAESISVQPPKEDIGALSGGDQQHVSIKLTGDVSGQHSVKAIVKSENAGRDQVVRHVKVRGTNRATNYLREIADANGEVSDASLATATEDWRRGEIPLKWLRSAIDAWREQEPIS